MGVHASDNENSESEDDGYPLKTLAMRDLRHSAKSLHQNELNLFIKLLL